jgi:hypothetical protein
MTTAELQAALIEYEDLGITAADIRTRRSALKKAIQETLFPAPKEGVNDRIWGPWSAKLNYKLTREVDEAVFDPLRKDLTKYKVDPDALVGWNPKLMLRVYRDLNKQQLRIADQFITTKPGSHDLEVTKLPS